MYVALQYHVEIEAAQALPCEKKVDTLRMGKQQTKRGRAQLRLSCKKDVSNCVSDGALAFGAGSRLTRD